MKKTNFKKNKRKKSQINIAPKKYLGQNFLVAGAYIKKIVSSAQLTKKDTVLEIGGGTGNLTKWLAQKAGEVITIEKDKNLKSVLEKNLSSFENVKIIEGDVLKAKIKLKNKKYKVVANLPYNITYPVIKKFLKAHYPPQEMILVVQKEVAERICARVPKMNKVAVFFQSFCQPKIIGKIPKTAFWPVPKVESAILKISKIQKHPELKKVSFKIFEKLVKVGFAHPRKQLFKNLMQGLKLEKRTVISLFEKAKIEKTQRAQELSLEKWFLLAKLLKNYKIK